MSRLALVLAFGAMFAAGLPSPGLFFAIGLGIAAIGCGWLGYTQRPAPGARRLAAAAAITVGVLGLLLGSARVVMTLVAIDRIERMLG
jgi:hypothetical protein